MDAPNDLKLTDVVGSSKFWHPIKNLCWKYSPGQIIFQNVDAVDNETFYRQEKICTISIVFCRKVSSRLHEAGNQSREKDNKLPLTFQVQFQFCFAVLSRSVFSVPAIPCVTFLCKPTNCKTQSILRQINWLECLLQRWPSQLNRVQFYLRMSWVFKSLTKSQIAHTDLYLNQRNYLM